MDPSVRWVHAQQSLIQAQAAKKPVVRGRWSGLVDLAVSAAQQVGLARPFVALVSFGLLVGVYLRQFSIERHKPGPGQLFVGIGALGEPRLVEQFAKMIGSQVAVTNETDHRSFTCLHRVRLRTLLREYAAAWRETNRVIGPTDGDHSFHWKYLATYLALNLHRYSWFRAWFRTFKDGGADEPVAFAAASYVAAAALAVGIKAVYFPHGFIARSVVLPDFVEVFCSNEPEARHYRKRLPGARVTLVRDSQWQIEPDHLVAIAGVYGSDVDFDLCRSFIEWAQSKAIPVIVRKHPKDLSPYWDQWRGVEGISFDDEKTSFEGFLRKRRPTLLVSWHSTALLDALMHGAVPVTVSPDSAFSDDLVFPFRESALRWPIQRSCIDHLMVSDAERRSLLCERQALVVGEIARAPVEQRNAVS